MSPTATLHSKRPQMRYFGQMPIKCPYWISDRNGYRLPRSLVVRQKPPRHAGTRGPVSAPTRLFRGRTYLVGEASTMVFPNARFKVQITFARSFEARFLPKAVSAR